MNKLKNNLFVKTTIRVAIFFVVINGAYAKSIKSALHCNLNNDRIVLLSVRSDGKFIEIASSKKFRIRKDGKWFLLELTDAMAENFDLTNSNISSAFEQKSKNVEEFALRVYENLFLNGKRLSKNEFIRKMKELRAKNLDIEYIPKIKKTQSKSKVAPFSKIGFLGNIEVKSVNLNNNIFKEALSFYETKRKKTLKKILRLYFTDLNTLKQDKASAMLDGMLLEKLLNVDKEFFSKKENYINIDNSLKTGSISEDIRKLSKSNIENILVLVYYTKAQEEQVKIVVKQLQQDNVGCILPLYYETGKSPLE